MKTKMTAAKNLLNLRIDGLTHGEAMSLLNGLRMRAEVSPVAADVEQSVRQAFLDAGRGDLICD